MLNPEKTRKKKLEFCINNADSEKEVNACRKNDELRKVAIHSDTNKYLPILAESKGIIGVEDKVYCPGWNHERHKVNLSNTTTDHKTPLSKGGSDDLDNKHILCLKCNSSKGDKDWKEKSEI